MEQQPAASLHQRSAFVRLRQHNYRQIDWFLVAALLVACAAAWPLIAQPGLLNTRGGGDSPFLLQRLHQLETALRDGHFPVRWMPDANYGYGYPFFNFYAPLSIYIAVLFRFLGFSYVRSIHLAQLAGFGAAAWGAYHLGRRWLGGSWAGLLTAVGYTLAPFHLVNIYVRGDSLAEFWAMAFYPLVLLAVDGVLESQKSQKPNQQQLGLLAFAYAGLILSHNISALIFSPFLLFYIFLRWVWVKPRTFKLIWPVLPALLLALALAAWFFLPALSEQSLAQLEPVTEGYFHYSNHFRGLDLVQTDWLFDYSIRGTRAFRMGLVQALTAVAGLLCLIFYPTRRQFAPDAFVGLTLLVSTLMLTPLTRLLWDHLPLLPFTQFPWRFLSVQALATALAAGTLARLPWPRRLIPLLAAGLLVSSLGRLSTDHLRLTDADVTAERLAQYEWFTANIGTTVSFEYLPRTVQPRPYTSAWLQTGERDRVQNLGGSPASVDLLTRLAAQQTWRIELADSPTTLVLPTLYWPGWQARLDGQPLDIDPAPGSGLIMLSVPPGVHIVELWLGHTPVRLVAELISLTALLVTLWLLRPRGWGRWLPSLAIATAVVTAILLLNRLWPQPLATLDDLTWDFAQMGYLHHDTEGVAFENGLVLHSYRYSQERLTPGETLVIHLAITSEAAGALTVALATPANVWPAVQEQAATAVVTAQTQLTSQTELVYQLVIPPDAPDGLYIPRLTFDNGQPLRPSGQTRGDLFLRPLRIAQGAAALEEPEDGWGATAVWVQLRTPELLDVHLRWQTPQPLSPNYNVALRLLDARGQEVAWLDGQPGYGLTPSSLWPAGKGIDDWLTLPLPHPLSGAAPYALVARLYEVTSGQIVLTRLLGDLAADLTFQPPVPVYALPEGVEGTTAVLQTSTLSQPLIQLRGYTLDHASEQIMVTLYWQALATIPQDYTRFAHLLDAATGELAAQIDGLPRRGSYPTSQWAVGEIVVDRVELTTAAVPPGLYTLTTGFYLNDGVDFPRLTAVALDGTPLPHNTISLTPTLSVP